MLDNELRTWRSGGTEHSTPWGTVFVRRRQGDGANLLFLHGYPTSSYDWHGVLPLLAENSVLTLDFLGFGFSAKPAGHRYSLFEQADIVEHVAAELTDGPVTVVAHDMGTSVATELMARDIEGDLNFPLRHVVLCNGSVILDRASLRPIQRVLRSPAGPLVSALANKRLFVRQLGAVFPPTHPLSQEEAERHWELLTVHNGHRQIHRLTSYLHERARHSARWHSAVREWPGAVGFLWGLLDPVATVDVLAGLRELRPAAPVHTLDDLGHYPQLDDPEAFRQGLATLLASD